MAKIGDRFVADMIDRGHREIGGFFYPDSNIAQPMYPLRGGYEVTKEANSRGVDEHETSLSDRLKQSGIGADDPGRDEPDQGIDRDI